MDVRCGGRLEGNPALQMTILLWCVVCLAQQSLQSSIAQNVAHMQKPQDKALHLAPDLFDQQVTTQWQCRPFLLNQHKQSQPPNKHQQHRLTCMAFISQSPPITSD